MEINGIESQLKSSYTAKRRMPPPFFLPKRGDRPTTIFFTPSLLGAFLYLLIKTPSYREQNSACVETKIPHQKPEDNLTTIELFFRIASHEHRICARSTTLSVQTIWLIAALFSRNIQAQSTDGNRHQTTGTAVQSTIQ